MLESASLTSSSLKGLMIASTYFHFDLPSPLAKNLRRPLRALIYLFLIYPP